MSKQSETCGKICKEIKMMRVALGCSQEWAALESNSSMTWWRKTESENGQPNMSLDTLNRAAKTLGVLPWVLGVLRLPDEELTAMIRKIPRMEQGAEGGQIGSNIVLLRKRQKLTQKQLAQMAGVSPARLRDIEHGCANTTILVLERIAGALGVPLLALSVLTVSEEDILAAVHSAQAAARMEAAS